VVFKARTTIISITVYATLGNPNTFRKLKQDERGSSLPDKFSTGTGQRILSAVPKGSSPRQIQYPSQLTAVAGI
jgi:hypothetical protein